MYNRREFGKVAAAGLISAPLLCKRGKTGNAAEPIPLVIDAKVKPEHTWKQYPTRTLAQLPSFPAEKQLSQYGGLLENRQKASGFFRVQKIGDRFWLIDPDGCRFLHKAVCTVSTKSSSSRTQESLKLKYGTPEKWMNSANSLLRQNGFNGFGCWSDVSLIRASKNPMAYTAAWNFMSSYGKKRGGTFQKPGNTGYPGDCIFAFDPEFETFCEEHAKQLAGLKDDPFLLGHFSDNEMPNNPQMLDNYLAIEDKKDPGKIAAQEWLRKIDVKPNEIKEEHRFAFMGVVGERYIKTVGKAIRKHDPNHLFLGARLHGRAKNLEIYFRAMSQGVDVMSVNLYGVWTPPQESMQKWSQWSGKPFMITEFYTKAEDSGMGNTSGAGWIVKTQKDRGAAYQNTVLALLESKQSVGWHFFKYMDNDPTAKGVDPSNVDSNKGIVNNFFEPYTDLLSSMKELHTQAYNIAEYFH